MGIFGKSKRQKAAELLQSGHPGVGTIVSVQDTGMTINDNPRIKLTMRIEPLDGSPAFDGYKTRTESRLTIPRQGERYPVYFDPADKEKTWLYQVPGDDSGRAIIKQAFGDVAESFVGMGVPGAPAAGGVDVAGQLTQLAELRDSGALSSDEFEAQKAKLLGS